MIKISSWIFFRWSMICLGEEIWYAWHVICKNKTKASSMTMQCSEMDSSSTIEIICPVNLLRYFAVSQQYIWKTVGNAVVEWRVKELTFALKRISVWTTSQWPYWQACIKAVYIQLAEHMLRYTTSTHLCHLISNKLNTGKSINWAYLAPVIPKVDLNAGFKQ